MARHDVLLALRPIFDGLIVLPLCGLDRFIHSRSADVGDIPASLDNIAPSLAGGFADTGLLHLLLNFVRQIINFARQR
ncbi:MAG: hypothetical protein DMG17_04970 [Acidobacteria bacterium]|nr:MAG: hypothetical protein DMG17_04970 [Acidobacteriota bacterium]